MKGLMFEAGKVKGTSCSLTEKGKDILESVKDFLSTQFEVIIFKFNIYINFFFFYEREIILRI